MKTITATKKGIAINYESTQKSSFIPYENYHQTQNQNQKRFEMNTIQYGMYQQLMYGMKCYTPEEQKGMDQHVVFSINKRHLRAMDVLNMFKYERTYGYINKLFKVIFPDIELSYYKDGKFAELPTLRQLKIDVTDVIDLWINNKLLPLDFYQINEQNLKL